MWVFRRPHFRRRYTRNVPSVAAGIPPSGGGSWLHAHIRRVTGRPRALNLGVRGFRPAFEPWTAAPAPDFLAAHIKRVTTRSRVQEEWRRPYRPRFVPQGVVSTDVSSGAFLAAHIRRMVSRQGRPIPRWVRPHPRFAPLYPLLGVSDVVTVYLTGRGHVVGGGATAGRVRSGGATQGRVTGGGATAGKVK